MKLTLLILEPKGAILEIARAAKERDLHVIALSSDEALIKNAPMAYQKGSQSIDETIMVDDWQNRSEVFRIFNRLRERYKLAGIYFGLEACSVAGALLRKSLDLPTTQAEVIELIINKYELRKKLQELHLSHLKNFRGSEMNGWTEWKFDGAAYFKPIYGLGSAYVERCKNLNDFQRALMKWNQRGTNDPKWVARYLDLSTDYHLEEAFDGELLSVESISFRGEFQPLGLLSRILYSKNPVVEMGSCFPYPHPLSEKILAFVKDVHEKLGITDGPTHTELIVNSKGEMEIIDLNPRFVGADVIQSINFAYGIRMENMLCDYALGKKPSFSPKFRKFSCLQYFLPPAVEELTSIQFPETEEVKFHTLFSKIGSKIIAKDTQFDYLGAYLTVMPTFDNAIERSASLRPRVRINERYAGVY